MRIPAIRGLIDRRVLANFRVDPDVLSIVLPAPFRPQIVNGFGIAGICLIRLKHMRPHFLPACVGMSSENVAHRIAVEWNANGQRHTGVFIPRRDTSSMINVVAGGRLFPGVQHRAQFDVRETENELRISMNSLDGSALVLVEGRTASHLPPDSVFASVTDVSRFFEAGSLGYSPDGSNDRFDGMELRSFNWHVEPLHISHVESSFFDDRDVFPVGSVALDNALLMLGIDHEWHSREPVCCYSSSENYPIDSSAAQCS